MSEYSNFLAMISTEFHRYLMENNEFASALPANTLVIFQVEGEMILINGTKRNH